MGATIDWRIENQIQSDGCLRFFSRFCTKILLDRSDLKEKGFTLVQACATGTVHHG